MGIKEDMRAWDLDATLRAKKLLHDMGYDKIQIDPAMLERPRWEQEVKVLAEQERARYQSILDERRKRLTEPFKYTLPDEYARAYWSTGIDELKKEENMSEANYHLPKVIKIAPHLEVYARSNTPVAAVQFTGNNVAELFDLLDLKQVTVIAPNKDVKQPMRATLATNSGSAVLVVDIDQYVVVEDGYVRILDAETFEARYEEIRALKAEPSLAVKKAKRRK